MSEPSLQREPGQQVESDSANRDHERRVRRAAIIPCRHGYHIIFRPCVVLDPISIHGLFYGEFCHASFDMDRAGELRAEAQKLYEEAARITHGGDRFPLILRAMELDAEAKAREQDHIPPAELPQHIAQQQQPESQSKDDKKK